jgi:hypothetical protein
MYSKPSEVTCQCILHGDWRDGEEKYRYQIDIYVTFEKIGEQISTLDLSNENVFPSFANAGRPQKKNSDIKSHLYPSLIASIIYIRLMYLQQKSNTLSFNSQMTRVKLYSDIIYTSTLNFPRETKKKPITPPNSRIR